MTWISLVCLLALSSSAFGRYAFGGGYGGSSFPQVQGVLTASRDLSSQQRPFLSSLSLSAPALAPVQSGYGQLPQQQTVDWTSSSVQQDIPVQQIAPVAQRLPTSFGSSYGAQTFPKSIESLPTQGYGQLNQGYGSSARLIQMEQPQLPVLSQADILCRGQRAETVIPVEGGRKFVVCLDDSKGVIQECPKSLFFHPDSRRCERKLGPLEDVCASQPCLNGAQCVLHESSYQCQCAPGFDGKNCELDARVCQTQQPCGQSSDVRCQSFRWGAALSYICIFQDGAAYGLNAQQVQPTPCKGTDGPHALLLSDKGFIMCDGERMYVESCPGGTIWDDLNKACSWPDQQGVVGLPQLDQQSSYGSSYGQQRPMITTPTFDTQTVVPRMHHHRHHSLPKSFDTYGGQSMIHRPQFDTSLLQQQPQVSTYGGQSIIHRPQFDTSLLQQQPQVSSYGSQSMIQRPQLDTSLLQQQPLPQVSSYGGQSMIQRPQFDTSLIQQQPQVSTYGARSMIQRPQLDTTLVQPQISSYGGAQTIQKPINWQQKSIQQDLTPVKPSSGY